MTCAAGAGLGSGACYSLPDMGMQAKFICAASTGLYCQARSSLCRVPQALADLRRQRHHAIVKSYEHGIEQACVDALSMCASASSAMCGNVWGDSASGLHCICQASFCHMQRFVAGCSASSRLPPAYS